MKRPTGRRSSRFVAPLRHAALFAVLGLLAALVVPSIAAAYHSGGREDTYTCLDCHGDSRDEWSGQGPHGYYITSGRKCRMCHTIHAAPASGILLLRTATVDASCMTCHDGTGAVGVYSAIHARGGIVLAEHTIGQTSTVPGGTKPLAGKLSCGSCHNVHRASQMASFTRDADKAFYHGYAYSSNNLLRDDVGGHPRGTYLQYGAAWCGGCHDQRLLGSGTHNHPVESTSTPGYFYYDRLAEMEDTASVVVTMGLLGYSNLGYVMPDPRNALQAGHSPICQQCHEDARSVGKVGAVTDFSASLKDYGVEPLPINPKFTSFPHQSVNRSMLVETDDNLCLNCHDAAMLQ